MVVGPTETNKSTVGPVEFWGEKIAILRKKYSLRNDNFVSRGLQRASTKTGKIFTLYHQELMKKRPILCTFCTQSVTRDQFPVYPRIHFCDGYCEVYVFFN